ncbi:MAG: FkbM family methyltransferase [Magnetospirillum sp.]|nr:FkbM family methyltransferase [Magnetospirillum sp.]
MLNVKFNFSVLSGEKAFVLNLDPSEGVQQGILNELKHGFFYEHETSTFMLNVMRDGDTAIDIGANIGFFSTLLGSLAGKTGKILAIEANPHNAERAADHLRLNGINGTVLAVGVGDSGGGALWIAASDGDSNGRLVPESEMTELPRDALRVSVTTLDDILPKNLTTTRIKIVKIDIEGWEYEALLGGRTLFTYYDIDYFIIEFHDKVKWHRIRALMREHGYETYLFNGEGNMPFYVPAYADIKPLAMINILFAKPKTIEKDFREVLANNFAGDFNRVVDRARAIVAHHLGPAGVRATGLSSP